jgi:E3 ubiquitin-protein ligase TRIP12
MIAEAEMEDEEDEDGPPADAVEDVDPTRNGAADGAAAGASAAEPSGTRRSTHPTAAAAAAAAPPRLLFSANGAGPFHPTTSVLQAVYAAALAAADADAGEEGAGARLSVATLWERTHTLQYMLTPKGEPIPPPLPGAAGASAAAATSADAEEALAAIGSTDRRAALGAALPALRGKVCGDAPPPGVAEQTDAILSALSVLRVLTASPARVMALGRADAEEASRRAASVALPAEAFVSAKLSGKLVRQLGDTLSLCSGSLPAWCVALARTCPFLFPFETRQQLFYCTTFGLARALHRMHGQTENGGGGQDLRVGRLQRQKVRVSRERILESAVKVFDMAPAHKMVLEVEFFDEVGTGTGPTLEFYTLLSRELASRALGAWRDADARSVDETGAKEPVTAPHGLFPAPMRVDAGDAGDAAAPKSPGGLKRLDLFRLLGRVVGKAMQDSRLLDVGLSPAFYRAAVGGAALSLPDVAAVDPELGRTLARLDAAAKRVAALRASGAPEAEWRGVTVDGAAVADLCLAFTLPGDDAFELRPGGADVAVDAANLGEYVDAVVDATVGGGVARQLEAFRGGLRDICQPAALGVFSASELERVLCGEGQAWTPELLSECVTFDHGYSVASPPIQALMEVLCAYGPEEQRAFLRFVTGAPRLPPGGLAALHPRLTVVCKQPSGAAGGAAGADGAPISAGTTLADKDLPSAMTCASYLKLPPYSCVEVLRERLGYAVNEGVGSFDLS